ncbi:MAG: SgcJ/EcaC family oxidoreductase [Alphaproteobacteria bacterium]|nr:SgcJ/EcaC family oxidoreductase [Alphaproteobacteria bacterium]
MFTPALLPSARAYTNAGDFGASLLSHDHTDDDRAIADIVARAEAAWNKGDAEAFCAEMADDVDFINVLGERHQGRDGVVRGHQFIFSTIYKDSRVRYTIDRIRYVRPDVALAFMHAKLISRLPANTITSAQRQSRLDEEMHESQARPTTVLAKDGGRWRIVAFHNTNIALQPTALA